MLQNKINRFNISPLEKSVILPLYSYFRDTDTNDMMKVEFESVIKDDKSVLIFCTFSDTRYKSEFLVPATFLPVISRVVKARLESSSNLREIIPATELRQWKITPFIKIKSLKGFKTLQETFSLELPGDNNE